MILARVHHSGQDQQPLKGNRQMTMRIWNPTHFTIGQPGRSNCPKWRGTLFQFEPNETIDVPDACGRYLVKQFGYLVAMPDRNIVTDPKEYDKLVREMGKRGIQELYKWATVVISNYRKLARNLIDDKRSAPRPDLFVLEAYEISKKYHSEVALTDSKAIKENEVMEKILGHVLYDSETLGETGLDKEHKENQPKKPVEAKALAEAPAAPTKKVEAPKESRVVKLPEDTPETESTMENYQKKMDFKKSAH